MDTNNIVIEAINQMEYEEINQPANLLITDLLKPKKKPYRKKNTIYQNV